MRILICIGVLFPVLCGSVLGQAPVASKPAESEKPGDVREAPRGAVFGFLKACHEGQYRRAASFLNLSRVRAQVDGAEMARELVEILDRKLTADPSRLSDSPDGDLTDGLAPDYELVGTVPLGARRVDLLLQRVKQPDGTQIWLFSQETLNLIPVLYDNIGTAYLDTVLPAWLQVKGPVDTAIWRWLALLLLAMLSVGIALLASRAVTALLCSSLRRLVTGSNGDVLAEIRAPVALLLGLALYRSGIVWIEPSVLLRTYLGWILSAMFYLGLAWLATRLMDVAAVELVTRMGKRQRASASSVVPLGKRTVKVVVVLIGVLAALNSWGVNISALLAGLGIGGLAVALAAQRTIENLFGGIAITSDRPVLVGDFCRYGDKFGTVEDIGLRSTRLRTLERTVVTVPNGQFSSLQIENFGKRDKIFFHPTISLRQDTTPQQIRAVLQGVRDLLLSHPKIDPDPARVRLIAIGTYSLDIEVFAYCKTTNGDEFLEVQEQLYLAILDVIAEAGTALAIPAQLSIVAADSRQLAGDDNVTVLPRDRRS